MPLTLTRHQTLNFERTGWSKDGPDENSGSVPKCHNTGRCTGLTHRTRPVCTGPKLRELCKMSLHRTLIRTRSVSHRTRPVCTGCKLRELLETASPLDELHRTQHKEFGKKLRSHRTLNSDTSVLIPDASGVYGKLFFSTKRSTLSSLASMCQHQSVSTLVHVC